MKRIKIVHIVGGLQSGGVEALLYNYFKYMNLPRFEVHIISHNPAVAECEQQFKELGFTIHIVPQKKKHPFKSTYMIYKIFKENKFDIAHAHMTLICFASLFIAKFAGIKIRIAHSHSFHSTGNLFGELLNKIFKALTRLSATDYFACGEYAGIYLFGDMAVKNGKVKILKNAIEINKFKYNENIRNIVRKNLNIEDKFCVGHIGRFTKEKNHSFLLDIFNDIQAKENNAILMLIGCGELENEIKQKVRKSGLQEKVIFLGVRHDVSEIYQAMDVFIFPSLFEGFGMVVIESQTASLLTFISEAVPREAILTEYCHIIPLNNSKDWANIVLNNRIHKRIDTSKEIKAAGYDITQSAHKLEEFYISRVDNL